MNSNTPSFSAPCSIISVPAALYIDPRGIFPKGTESYGIKIRKCEMDQFETTR